jgi:hypothetical protein
VFFNEKQITDGISRIQNREVSHWSRYMTIKKLAGKVAVPVGGWRGIVAVLVKHLAADGADVASVL